MNADERLHGIDRAPEDWSLPNDDAAPTPDEENRRGPLCIACHERACDCSQNPDSQLCAECRRRLTKLRVPLGVKAFLGALCALFALSAVLFASTFGSFRIYLRAESQMRAREYSRAYTGYRAVLETYGESVPVALKAADAAMGAQDFYWLADTLETYLFDRDLSDSEYDHAMRYVNFLDRYFFTLDELDVIFAQVGEVTESNAAVNARGLLEARIKMLLSHVDTDKTLVYFYLGSYAGDIDSAIAYYKAATEQDALCTYPLAFYGNVLRYGGRYDEARGTYEAALARNTCDALAMRGLAILQLLDGQIDLSLATMRAAYELEPYSSYVCDALIVALCEADARDEAMRMMNQFIEIGFEADEELRDYLAGGVTPYQYYVNQERGD